MNPLPVPARDVLTLGQVFTPDAIVELMLGLRSRSGRVLEPSAGDGAFARRLPGCVAIEFDPAVAGPGVRVMDFFAYPQEERFNTVIGNPPYVRYQDIAPSTRSLLDSTIFDTRSNLYLFFIEKCLRHLAPQGELIFIVPRDFIKLTGARQLNQRLFAEGTITHWVETGDTRIFDGAIPNCAIFRFERDNFSRQTLWRRITDRDWTQREFVHLDGQLAFSSTELSVPLAALFEVKVGAVSGADEVFTHPEGNLELVCSHTAETGRTRRMFYNQGQQQLVVHKPRLLARRIKTFDESNWWRWGRGYPENDRPRIYVNGKTRRPQPFFTHECRAFDGAILALFARDPDLDTGAAARLLNQAVPWEELGFFVDGRFLFTQRSLQTLMLPSVFESMLPAR